MLSRNSCCSAKAISITYSEFVFVALGILHAQRMRRILLSSAACPALQQFYTLSPKWQDFRAKKCTKHKMCFDFRYKFCVKHFAF